VTLNPIFNMCLTGDMSLEELIRQLYPARNWALAHDLDIEYANHQETPTLAWAMVPVLVGSGVTHLVKSVLPYECPWAERLEEPPVYWWEGPDGSQILVRFRNGDYVEGRFVLQGLRATNTALHDSIIPRYEALGDVYPFDAAALVGCYGDLAPDSHELPARKAATIAAYNAQDWDYPKLINASHKRFWDDVEEQITVRGAQVPVLKGDYGTSWEAWPACLARDFAGWRRAQERAAIADKLVALVSRLNRQRYEGQRENLARGWDNLVYLADHAWNGANDANRELNAALRHQWQVAANTSFDHVVSKGLAAVAEKVPTEDASRILVFNSLGWPRTGTVTITGTPADAHIVDVASGQHVPTQPDGDTLRIEARDVPAVGYRVLEVRESGAPPSSEPDAWKASAHRLEGRFYAVEVSPVTGGIVSLYDKVRGQELVDSDSPYHANQCLYLSDGIEHTPQAATVEVEEGGAVFGRLIVRAGLKNTQMTTTITLYTHIDRIDIRNEVSKQATTEKQELHFAFPFDVPGHRYRLEAPGAIIDPSEDLRPGAGQAYNAVRHFVDVFNDDFGITLSSIDSGLVEFGHRTTLEDPVAPDPENSTVLALVMDNVIDWNESIRDQAGVNEFVFRFSLRSHDGGFDPVAAVRSGWEANDELEAVSLSTGQKAEDGLPPDVHRFLKLAPDNVILTSMKVAEEEGLIIRLWECAGQDTVATVEPSGLGSLREAQATDLLERTTGTLSVGNGQVEVPVSALGLSTIRLLFNTDSRH
jgi:alpha-mannosidase